MPPDSPQDIPVIDQQEAALRQQSGGYDANGNPADPAMVDMQSPAAKARRMPPPDVVPPNKGPSAVGAINTSYQSGQASGNALPSVGPYSPYDVEIPKNPSAIALKNIAGQAGIDTTKLPDSYWQNMSQHYQNVENPGTLTAVQSWLKASGLGHFMQGVDSGGSDMPLTATDLEKAGRPEMAAQMRADQFFNAHVQARIIDGGKYIDGNGNYAPPASYKVGTMLSGIFSQPAASLSGQFAAERAAAGIKPLVNGTMAFMAAHPQAAQVLNQALKYTGFAMAAKYVLGGHSMSIPPTP